MPSGGTPTHGHTVGGAWSPTYRSWNAMIARCTYPSQSAYPMYGGRGITVCERWRSFEAFLADMGERPDGHTIDRIDPDGNYEPGNCRWATMSEQQRNKRPGWHRNERKTQCPAGHPYDEANTYVTKQGHRLCRACHRERERERKMANPQITANMRDALRLMYHSTTGVHPYDRRHERTFRALKRHGLAKMGASGRWNVTDAGAQLLETAKVAPLRAVNKESA